MKPPGVVPVSNPCVVAKAVHLAKLAYGPHRQRSAGPTQRGAGVARRQAPYDRRLEPLGFPAGSGVPALFGRVTGRGAAGNSCRSRRNRSRSLSSTMKTPGERVTSGTPAATRARRIVLALPTRARRAAVAILMSGIRDELSNQVADSSTIICALTLECTRMRNKARVPRRGLARIAQPTTAALPAAWPMLRQRAGRAAHRHSAGESRLHAINPASPKVALAPKRSCYGEGVMKYWHPYSPTPILKPPFLTHS